MKLFLSFLRAWFGHEEYRASWHKQSRTRSFYIAFWGRLLLASAGLSFFLWQQVTEPSQWWGSDTFAIVVLALTVSQSAGPLVCLLMQVTRGVFLTRHYREAVSEGKFYMTATSALCIVLMTALSFLAAYGYLGTRWYMKPLVFLLTVPVAWFWVMLPALNWARVKGRRFILEE